MMGCMILMGLGMLVWLLLGIALLVLTIVATIRLWPRRNQTFQSSERGDIER